MAEHDAAYLAQCREKNICPLCHQNIVKKHGSGSFVDGVFCSQDCYAQWHSSSLQQRHEDRLKRSKSDD